MGSRNGRVSRLVRVEQWSAARADRDTGPTVGEFLDPDDVEAWQALAIVLDREREDQEVPEYWAASRVEEVSLACQLLYAHLRLVEALAERLGRLPTTDEIRRERETRG